jgi:hypothetical protein
MQATPEQIARHTVDQNGGEYTTDAADLLELFNRQQLTETARKEVRDALESVGVGTDPDLFVATRADKIRLFVLQREWVEAAPSRTGWQERLRPRTWKGWLVYGVVGIVILSAVFGGSEEPKQAVPAAQTVEESAPAADSDNDAAAARARREARHERQQLRRERAQLKRQQAAARRKRARARAAARRERERQAELAALAAEPEPEPVAAECHPSYDPCLDPNASDYDCSGGEGDGPKYTGTVTVTGSDDFDLDRDGDGTGCD